MRTIESAGHSIGEVRLDKDGSIRITTQPPLNGEHEGERPNSFDQVLGTR
jgi:hypothetical protein